jgi:hypothetical protein
VKDANPLILVVCVICSCPTDALKFPVTVETDADREVKDALLCENDVATDELKSPVTDATLADKEVILALLELNDVATD